MEKSILRRSGLVLWVATTLACATPCVGQAVDPTDGSPTQAQQPDAPELATESPFVIQADPARRSGGRPLIVIDESEWITQVIDHRTASHILGQREVKTADGARDLIPFYGDYSDKLASRTIPVPPTFTNVQMFALSDTGRVVGFASRPMGTSNRNLQGIVWEAVNDQIHLLDPPTTYHGSCAYDISADGRRVSGYVLGKSPPRMVPCVWDEVDGRWIPTVLEPLFRYNPLLVGGHVVISDDGMRVAANLATVQSDQPIARYRNRVFQWRTPIRPGSTTTTGQWQREQVVEHAVNLANINNQGLLAGRISDAGVRRACIADCDSGRTWILRPPPDHYASEALDVNNRGQVVGYYDDPPGPEGTSRAFLWHQGRAELLSMPAGTVFSQATSIDDQGLAGGMFAVVDEQPDAQAPDADKANTPVAPSHEAKLRGFLIPAAR